MQAYFLEIGEQTHDRHGTHEAPPWGGMKRLYLRHLALAIGVVSGVVYGLTSSPPHPAESGLHWLAPLCGGAVGGCAVSAVTRWFDAFASHFGLRR